MSERLPESESFLTEIDRRLRAIQAELAPGRAGRTASDGQRPLAERGRAGPLATILERDPGTGRPGPPSWSGLGGAPGPAGATEAVGPADAHSEPEPAPEVAALARQVQSLTEAQAKLIAAGERLLETFERRAAGPDVVTMSAGPFEGTDAVREFERTLAELPGVGCVAVRGYEGADRAILDVELQPPPSGATP
jgi:hypothetical protein